ncbi:MAG TPA: RnfH family protein [Burkholderiaceae bacterium]|nr:RnfH family protein [Burkholderiaceae bacterium]
MANSGTVRVTLVYARPGFVWRRALRLPAGSTVWQAIQKSGFMDQVPDQGGIVSCGIFGQSCGNDRVLADGDRVEILRPLVFDPMESRRRRAAHRAARALPGKR